MAFDPLGAEAAVKAARPLVDHIVGAIEGGVSVIEGCVDRLGATVITIGPITIPAFKIAIEMPSSAIERLNPPPKE